MQRAKKYVYGVMMALALSLYAEELFYINPWPSFKFPNEIVLHAIDNNKVFLADREGLFMKTLDGEITWTKSYPFPYADYRGIHFVNENVGYIVGKITDNTSRIIVIKTTDGGESWYIQYEEVSGMRLEDVIFPSGPDTGYAVGGNFYEYSPQCLILITYDGGVTWTKIVNPSDSVEPSHSVYFVNNRIGFAVGSYYGSQKNLFIEKSIFLKTTDAGNTWVVKNLGFDTALRGVYFLDSLKGYVVGHNGLILKTTDGGNTWSQLNSGVSTPLYNVYFKDSLNGYIGGYKLILKTTDGGITWTQYNIGDDGFSSIIFPENSDTGWAAGYGGQLIKTYNAGQTWTTLNHLVIDSLLNDVYFPSQDTGFIVGWGVVLRSVDKGISWDIAYQTNKKLYGVHFPENSLTGYAVGYSSTALKTQDGGITWTNIAPSGTYNFRDVFFVNNTTGYICGRNGNSQGVVLKTEDGGITWSTIYITSETFEFTSLYFKGDTGYVGGGTVVPNWNCRILKTTDGGQTWIVFNNPAGKSGYIFDICMASSDTVYAIGGQSTALDPPGVRTFNGGQTWEALDIGGNSIYMINGRRGYIASGNALKRTHNGWTTYELVGNHRTSPYYNQLRKVFINDTLFTDDIPIGIVLGGYNPSGAQQGVILGLFREGSVNIKELGKKVRPAKIYTRILFQNFLALNIPKDLKIPLITSLTDISGRIVYHKIIFVPADRINLKFSKSGIYFLKISDATKGYTFKIIKP